jgi:hypothetical protein
VQLWKQSLEHGDRSPSAKAGAIALTPWGLVLDLIALGLNPAADSWLAVIALHKNHLVEGGLPFIPLCFLET